MNNKVDDEDQWPSFKDYRQIMDRCGKYTEVVLSNIRPSDPENKDKDKMVVKKSNSILRTKTLIINCLIIFSQIGKSLKY